MDFFCSHVFPNFRGKTLKLGTVGISFSDCSHSHPGTYILAFHHESIQDFIEDFHGHSL